jgi:hypothetical protein
MQLWLQEPNGTAQDQHSGFVLASVKVHSLLSTSHSLENSLHEHAASGATGSLFLELTAQYQQLANLAFLDGLHPLRC